MRVPTVLIFFVSALGCRVAATTAKTKARRNQEVPEKTGLALCGGSFIAASIGGSILRGFQMQKLNLDGEQRPALEVFDYISGLSGGNVPSIIYSYARDTNSDELLDADGINDPAELTAEYLENVPENSMFKLFVMSNEFAVYQTIAAVFLLKANFYVAFTYFYMLAPFGIFPKQLVGGNGKDSYGYIAPRSDVKATSVVEMSIAGPVELYPAWLFTHLNVGPVNDLKEMADNLTTVDVPSLGELQKWDNEIVLDAVKKHGYQVPLPIFATPEELTCPFIESEIKFDPVGNVTAEPFDHEPFVLSTEEAELSLGTMLAAGTALLPFLLQLGVAYGGIGVWEGIESSPLGPAFSEPIRMDVPTANGDKRTMALVDGGYNDASGIPALVSMKVRNIVAVYFTGGDDDDDKVAASVGYVTRFFGVGDLETMLGGDPGVGGAYMNHLFGLDSNGENQLEKLEKILRAQHEAGNPLIATLEDLVVVENPFWGTAAGEKVDLTIIAVTGVPDKFAERIPEGVVTPPEGMSRTENGFFTNEEVNRIPTKMGGKDLVLQFFNYTIPGLDFAMGKKEIRMTNVLCSWMVKEAWEGLKDVNGTTIFDGFKKILDPSHSEDHTEEVAQTNPDDEIPESGVATEGTESEVAAEGDTQESPPEIDENEVAPQSASVVVAHSALATVVSAAMGVFVALV